MEQRCMEVLFEDIRSKFDLVLEGEAALHSKIDEFRQESNEKHDLRALRISVLKKRIDSVDRNLKVVATDLAAHRADTEAHPRYIVRE